jgi:hypothetical protein
MCSEVAAEDVNLVSIHLVEAFGARELTSFKRDELQAVLDEDAQAGLSFSTVDHLSGTLSRFLIWPSPKATSSVIPPFFFTHQEMLAAPSAAS